MQQSTLDQYVSREKRIKTIFYLNWVSEPYAVWLDEIPNEDINFTTKINWRQEKEKITICGTLKQESYEIPEESYYQNISYLKSHLQKCIRRKLHDKAVKTAFHMIKLDIQEFLRRLPIIMIEDVTLHDSLPIIVWLMAACTNKEFIVQEEHIKWLLDIVYILCEIKEHDKSHSQDKIKDISRYHKLENDDKLSLLYSLQLRGGYGGMKCDIKMINYFSDLWYHRFEDGRDCNKLHINKKYDINSIEKLSKKEWEIAAIDFHCAPYMIGWLQKKFDDFDEDEFKNIIWHNSSKINIRDKFDDKGTAEYWNKIKTEVIIIQSYILKNYI